MILVSREYDESPKKNERIWGRGQKETRETLE